MTDWPHGSGEMAERIRTFDWASTSLGALEGWPQSRKIVVDMMLGSGHAMQLALGPERVLLYNDAYAPMLAGRHPQALGIPFRAAWPEIWHDIEPLVARVFAGETVKFDNLPLVMTRRGYPEDTWWNFSYSPVRDESGAIAGLLNVTVDATAKHRAEQAERERDAANLSLQKNEARFRALVTTSANSIYRMSPDWRQMYQLDSETLANTTAPVEDWVAKYIPDEDLPGVLEAIDKAIGTKSLFEFEHRVRHADGSVGWVLSRAVPLLDEDGEIVEWFGAATDMSARREAIGRLHKSEEQYRELFEAAQRRAAELGARGRCASWWWTTSAIRRTPCRSCCGCKATRPSPRTPVRRRSNVRTAAAPTWCCWTWACPGWTASRWRAACATSSPTARRCRSSR